MLKLLHANKKNFSKKLIFFLEKRKISQNANLGNIKKIIRSVKSLGDKSLISYEKRFSKIKIKNNKLKFSEKEINYILKKVDKNLKASIDIAFNRILNFHSKQKKIYLK